MSVFHWTNLRKRIPRVCMYNRISWNFVFSSNPCTRGTWNFDSSSNPCTRLHESEKTKSWDVLKKKYQIAKWCRGGGSGGRVHFFFWIWHIFLIFNLKILQIWFSYVSRCHLKAFFTRLSKQVSLFDISDWKKIENCVRSCQHIGGTPCNKISVYDISFRVCNTSKI